ncbi:MAG: tetratricopeptide repeat protein [Desulfovibrionaceae bacterium]|nr:tetratricopeptide repeat protein [Desulfovibrionaceae bacterium]
MSLYFKRELSLDSGDILDLQSELCEDFAKIIKFSGHTLYFPIDQSLGQPQILPKENKLLLPLLWENRKLGVLVLHNVDLKKANQLLGTLPDIAQVILGKLAYLKDQQICAQTSLIKEEAIYAKMEEASNAVRSPEVFAQDWTKLPAYKLCLGLVIIHFVNFEELALKHSFGLIQELRVKLACELRANARQEQLAVRLGAYDMGLFFQAPGRETCRKIAESLLKSLKKVVITNPLTNQNIHPILTAGFGFYPYDLTATETKLAIQEQGHLLVERVRLAAEVAHPWQVQGYAQMLKSGGRIIGNLPMGRFHINLGRLMGVVAGQTFSGFGGENSTVYKGDLTIVQARKKYAIAESTYKVKADLQPTVGDRLELLKNATDRHIGSSEELAGTEDFYAQMHGQSANLRLFTLVMVQLEDVVDKTSDECCLEVQAAWQKLFEQKDPELLRGRHGPNLLLYFHPNVEAQSINDKYIALYEQLKAQGLRSVIGLVEYPFLDISRTQIPDYGLKTLEYAQLLPEPKVGICNSVAINISADRLYSLGDLFGALEEYKLALLADANNDLAWNSMGVCMAAMGHFEDAKRHFLEALRRNPSSQQQAEIYYNLGTLWQSLGDEKESQKAFEQSVQADPLHLYAWIRLGLLAEHDGDFVRAREIYGKCQEIEASGYSSNLAVRHLANLAILEDRSDEARVLLQEALQRDPNDAQAMLLLAKIYLAGGDDPAIAELLARKSLNVQEKAEAWQVLASALRSQGQTELASQAEAKAAAF